MNWNVGQKVAALCSVGIYNHEGIWLENVIEFDKVYQISSIEPACCMNLLDVGKIFDGKGTALLYKCEKCKKDYQFKENEPILLNEKWFRPINENESRLSKAIRKIANLFSKGKKTDGYFIKIKIRVPIPPSFLEPEESPVPKREVEVQPEWAELD